MIYFQHVQEWHILILVMLPGHQVNDKCNIKNEVYPTQISSKPQNWFYYL